MRYNSIENKKIIIFLYIILYNNKIIKSLLNNNRIIKKNNNNNQKFNNYTNSTNYCLCVNTKINGNNVINHRNNVPKKYLFNNEIDIIYEMCVFIKRKFKNDKRINRIIYSEKKTEFNDSKKSFNTFYMSKQKKYDNDKLNEEKERYKKRKKKIINNNIIINNNYIMKALIMIKSIIIINIFLKAKNNIFNICYYQYSKITLKVKGIGEKQIFGSNFQGINYLNQVYINGNEVDMKANKYIFNQTENLVELIWDDNINNTRYMFKGCINITEINLSNFNTSLVEDMGYMFYDCRSLTSLDLSNFNIH